MKQQNPQIRAKKWNAQPQFPQSLFMKQRQRKAQRRMKKSSGINGLTAAWTLDGQTYTAQPEIRDDHSYRLEIPLSGLDYRRSYAIELTVSDAAMTASQSLTVHKGLPVFDWGEGDFRFHVPVELPELTIGGIPLADYIRGIMKE